MNFDNINFKGTFRDYQARVLDNFQEFLSDGKIHIVASPGSGKTILGLELIRKLNQPVLILSPTTTIRNQWGERFNDWYSTDPLFSFSLLKPNLLTSITYQALHSIMNKKVLMEDDNEEDFQSSDIYKILKESNIKTICLDEAHHLQNEWQKSLEKFILRLNKDFTIISLTATPPYDATAQERRRYISVCGEIDDEIFVPKLVKEGSLCPHQDYIYFNYPTEKEIKGLKDYKNNVFLAISEISSLDSFNKFVTDLQSEIFFDSESFFKNVSSFSSLFSFINSLGKPYNKKYAKLISGSTNLPKFTLSRAETAIQFMLSDELIKDDQFKEEIIFILKKYDLLSRGRVSLNNNEKLKRELISSLGKLDSIVNIVKVEHNNLNKNLRMLILTDYIKKESINDITNSSPSSINVVSIFEVIRRNEITENIAILSGGLVVIHENLLAEVRNTSKKENIKFTKKLIAGTKYFQIDFRSDNKNKVRIVGALFERGLINILIGTKSLLGEGWDSPCINSLILASFVGSFILSNQMRGRAIRVDKNNPNKVANIWHLVTIEPEYLFESNILKKTELKLFPDKTNFISNDFEVLSRRFDNFVGPCYDKDIIESGIERISIITPPFTRKKFKEINDSMLLISTNRSDLQNKRNRCISSTTNLNAVTEIEKDKRVLPFTYFNVLPILFFSFLEASFASSFTVGLVKNANIVFIIATLLGIIIISFLWGRALVKILNVVSPKRSIEKLSKAILCTLKQINEIGDGTKIRVSTDKKSVFIHVSLSGATIHEENIFNKAIAELLSPIENPRYIIRCKLRGIPSNVASYACPSIIGANKEIVKIFASHLHNILGKVDLIYTRTEEGRKKLLKCRNNSFITANALQLKIKKKSSKRD